jgi:signal transduction histidine kinase
VRHLRLDNLPVSGSVTMVAEMLHVAPAAAAGLVGVIEAHTSGNPYQTVELLNALRREGPLMATAGGWRWDAAALGAHLGVSEVAGLLAARVEALPAASRTMVQAMACLGGRAELSLLHTATGEPAGAVEQALAPALDDGLLVAEAGAHPAVRFRHDRTREGIRGGLDPPRRRALQLGMARRLAAVPELFAVAAGQYLPVADAVDDAAERRGVVELLRRGAGQATLTGDYAQVTALLTAALRLIDPGETATLIAVHTGRHAALFCLGRLEEADEEYRTIEQLGPAVLDRADATVVQVHSLTKRNRLADAIGLGHQALRELGVTVPAPDRLPAELDQQFGHLYRWLDDTEAADDLARPDITDPALLAATRLLDAVLLAYVAAPAMYAWLSLESVRIWLQHGPSRTLAGPATYAASTAASRRGDYAAGYRAARRILAFCEARGYEPETSLARYWFSVLSWWFEPIESGLDAVRRAREGLIAGADLVYAGRTYYVGVCYQLDCAPSLDDYIAEVEAGLAFARRTGNEFVGQVLDAHRWLAGVLRGESAATATEAASIDSNAGNPRALLHAHLTRAIAAAIFGDPAGLARHTAATMPLLPAFVGAYSTTVARLLRGLALAAYARDSHNDQRGGGLLSELDEVTRWLAARAADAPENFRHLLRLAEAERAWAAGDFRAAAVAFDAARREAAGRRRRWHRALIAERAARFCLAHGLDQAGYDLLAEARQDYAAWGATAKVAQLDWAYPTLRPEAETPAGHRPGQSADLPRHRSTVTTGTIDLLGIVSASQVLSSETSIGRLHARVVEVLSAMTGATGVHLLLWNDDRHDWLLPAPGGGIVPVSGTGHERAVPMSVLRYAERIREPLLVGDATQDDRFARDPYFADADCCSLLAVPILGRGTLRAVLLLENRLIRGAFTTERLDTVQLIAGQLAVSLDNAQLYAEFRRVADEQAALRRVAVLVARAVPSEEVFAAVAAEVGQVLDIGLTAMSRYDPDGAATVLATWARTGAHPLRAGDRLELGGCNVNTLVFQAGRPARIEDYADASGPVAAALRAVEVRSAVGAPVSVEGRLWGVITVWSTRAELLPADSEARLAGFTELVATAIANAESRAALTASRARIVATADQTRRRIERDLHDGAQQHLVSLIRQLRAAKAEVPPGAAGLVQRLDGAAAGLTGVLEEVREIARGLHPAILADGGLGPALKGLARRSAVPVRLDVLVEGRLPEPVEIAAYYVVSEALTNAAKHADASAAEVQVAAGDGVLHVRIRDDGRGGAGFGRGSGLVGLRDRVEALGGRLSLHSPPGAGTTMEITLPVTDPSRPRPPAAAVGPPDDAGRGMSAGGVREHSLPRRPHQTREQRKEGGAMTTFGTKRIGGLALAVASMTALAACTSSSRTTATPTTPGAVTQPGSVGEIPAAGTPSGTVGSITYALQPGTAPNWILPMPTAASDTDYNVFTFEWEMWRPMYYAPSGSTPTVDSALSPVNPPVWSNGGKTMSITVKPWKWSNGQMLSSKDLLFTFDELEAAVKASPANWGTFVPGFFPQTITSMSTPNDTTLVVNMKSPINPTWMEEDILGPQPIMPAAEWAKASANGPTLDFTNPANATKIFNYLTAQSESLSTYATNPLWQTVDGPYKLSSYDTTTGAFTMVPNTDYSGPHATPMSDFVGVPFTSNTAFWNAIKTGSVDVGYVPPEDFPQIPTLKGLGYNYYGLPVFGSSFVVYNFQDKTGDFNNIVAQLYFRQAMQHLEDQAGQIKAVYNGDADPAYGPIPVYPKSPFLPANAAANPYPFSVSDATSVLKANGWNVVANGTDTCAHAGTAPGDCGAGIRAGTKLAFNLIYNTTSPFPQLTEDLVSNARAAGIEISLQGSNFNYMTTNYNDATSPANADKWAAEDFGGETNSTYPTQFGFLYTGGSGDIGDYSNPTADSLINASVSGSNPSAVTNEASFFTAQVPVLWQPARDRIYVWKTNISATDPSAFENLTQHTATPEFWYLNK